MIGIDFWEQLNERQNERTQAHSRTDSRVIKSQLIAWKINHSLKTAQKILYTNIIGNDFGNNLVKELRLIVGPTPTLLNHW